MTFGELATFQEGYVNPKQGTPGYFGGPIKWLRAVDLNDGFVRDTSRTLTEEGFKSAGKSALLFEPDTIAISKSGTIGRLGILKDYMCGNRAVINICPKLDVCDLRYLFYALRHKYDSIVQRAEGSVQKNLYVSALSGVTVSVPNITTQREIASILGALDDKIELNRRMSATLEEMARSLYRSWFVDFDPVHAKMEGRQPAFMDAATVALFPDRFGEDGLPEGWKLGKLSDLIDFNPTERLSKGIEAPYLDMKSLPTSGMQHKPAVHRSFTSGTKFRNGDTLLARITPCLENGKTALVQGLEGDAVGWGSTEFIVMRPAGDTALAYPYCAARSSDFRDEAIASMTGSSGRQRADAGRIKSVDAVIPPREIMTEFSSMTDPMIGKIAVLSSENQTLAALRDSLLPKLMSGELRVGEARAQIEEVA